MEPNGDNSDANSSNSNNNNNNGEPRAAPPASDPFRYDPKDYRHFGVSNKRPVEMEEVKTGYMNSPVFNTRIVLLSFVICVGVFLWGESTHLFAEMNNLKTLLDTQIETVGDLLSSLQYDITILVTLVTVLILSLIYYFSSATSVYLVDFAVFQPDDKYKIPHDRFMEKTRRTNFFSPENCDFQEKILRRSGLGEETYLPPGVHQEPPVLTMQSAREEAEYVLSGCLDDLFARTGIKPKDVDILIVNCSLFNPTPSLSAMVIQKYKMRDNVRNYNLAGMGCSAGVIAVDLAKDLLQVHRNSIAVVISTENITQNWYRGNERGMIVSNCIFRTGGAAMLLSNRPKDYFTAKYKLLHTIRIHRGSNEEAYKSVFQEEDEQGKVGVRLSKDLIKVVGDALKTNLTVLGPLVLPIPEQVKFFINYVQRKFLKQNVKPYTPDFKTAFNHFCIHAGGRAVIDGLEQNLKLSPVHLLPSRATLYRVGNTSSSSIWYELAFTEQTGRLKKGEQICQIAFGSGFKCNSAVWKALRDINDESRQPFWQNLSGLAEEYQAVLAEDRKRQQRNK